MYDILSMTRGEEWEKRTTKPDNYKHSTTIARALPECTMMRVTAGRMGICDRYYFYSMFYGKQEDGRTKDVLTYAIMRGNDI